MNNIGCRLRNGPTKLSIVQACFSIGGTLSPFFATPFAERVPDRPYLYFYIAMGVAAFTLSIMLLAFIRGGIDDIIGGIPGSKITSPTERGTEYDALLRDQGISANGETGQGESWKKISRMVSDPLVLSLMLWSFFYVSQRSPRGSSPMPADV